MVKAGEETKWHEREYDCDYCHKKESASHVNAPPDWIWVCRQAPPVAWSGYFCSTEHLCLQLIGRDEIERLRVKIGLNTFQP